MRGYKFLLLKAYFDKGWALTNYFKYLLAFSGIFNLITAKTAIITAIVYCFACLLLGWIWFKVGLVDTENEIQNIFNPFVKDVRLKLLSKA